MINKDDIDAARVESAEILCGPVPDEAAKSCLPSTSPCLFNIKDDPCEYYNLASKEPEVLNDLIKRLAVYNATAVTPRNKPSDPDANPDRFDGVWTSWC